MDSKKPQRHKGASPGATSGKGSRGRARKSVSKSRGSSGDFDGRASEGTSGTGWTGLADLSEFELDAGDMGSEMSGTFRAASYVTAENTFRNARA